jgi:MFS family permease
MSHTPHPPDDPHVTPPLIQERQGRGSAWSPLRAPLFRALWIATVVSNVGTWMQNVGAAWFMMSLSPSPTLVALVQAATSLPVFLVGLPAGALADIVDRRRLLLWTQGWMLVITAVLSGLTFLGVVTPWVLLTLTFALGLGAALNAPAWQAIVSELVPRADLQAAVTLNGVGFNVARAVGPALGGIVVAVAGVGAVFLLNAISFLGVLAVLFRWQRTPRENALPPEHVLGAMRAGLRYVRYAASVHAVLIRTGLVMLCGSALWALLPLVARAELGLAAIAYGMLLGALGVGAVVGATLLPRVRQRVTVDLLLTGATILFAAVTLALAYVREFVWLCAAMAGGGIAWITLMSSFNTAVQTAVPAWVRARALAAYLLVSQGGLAAGSAVWGAVATHVGTTTALLWATCGLILGLAVTGYYRIGGEAVDVTPSLHWPEPTMTSAPRPEDGPVLVTIEYRIDPHHARDFAAAMQDLRVVRRRDGAMYWELFRDGADPRRYLEIFLTESWAEHLRQHTRVVIADRAVEQRVRAFHIGDGPVVVSHFISAYAVEA